MHRELEGMMKHIQISTLGQMIKYMDAGTKVLKQTDFSGLCQSLFVHLHRHTPVCQRQFPLFDKHSSADEAKFIGYATVSCGNSGPAADLQAVLNMCAWRPL